MLFLKHPAWLWIKKHRRELIPPLDENLQSRFDQGHDFERYVESIFCDLTKLGFHDYGSYQALAETTKKTWESGAVTVAQGRYEFNEITCIVDLLSKRDDGSYNLIEIKSSTSKKQEHIFDLAFQFVVLEGAGYKISKCELALVNKDYVLKGDIEVENLIKFVDVTANVLEKIESTKQRIDAALATIKQSQMPSPSPELARLGSYSEWLQIRHQILPEIPENSIHNLPFMNAEKATKLLEMGIETSELITDPSILNKSTQKYIRAKKLGKRIVDKNRLEAFLKKIEYPIHFFDYETSQNLVPIWNNTKPYQQVTFQYSLHIQYEPFGKIFHFEYLHRDKSNPAPELLKMLEQHLESSGSVLVWYENFERSRNVEMAEVYQNFRNLLLGVNNRMVDLMLPFSEEMVIDPLFKGSSSIKSVLPVFNPQLSYKDLNIQEGGSASRLWKKATFEIDDESIKTEIYDDLVKYCERDTFAMVEIHNQLRQLIFN